MLAIPLGLVVLQACAGPERETQPAAVKPTAPGPDLSGLTIRIYPEGSDIGREVAMALETELARAGAEVVAENRRPNAAPLHLFLDLRSIGVAVEGVTSLSVESDGRLIDRLTTQLWTLQPRTRSRTSRRAKAWHGGYPCSRSILVRAYRSDPGGFRQGN